MSISEYFIPFTRIGISLKGGRFRTYECVELAAAHGLKINLIRFPSNPGSDVQFYHGA